jgi:hypothetical protein
MMRLCWRYLSLCLLFIIGATSAACTQPAASTPVGSVADQIARGEAIYARDCATAQCHGVQGEGIRSGDGFSVWPLVGPEFTERNPTAQVIFDVTRSGPEREMRALTDQEHYDAIAYELSLNGVRLAEPVTAANAITILSGAEAALPAPGTLFPPPGNATLIDGGEFTLPASAEDQAWRLHVTQAALVSYIAGRPAPDDGRFLIVVFFLETRRAGPAAVTPADLALHTVAGATLAPQPVALDFAVARFGQQTIEPGRGVSGHAVFVLPAGAAPASLRYASASVSLTDDQTP